MTLPTYVYPKRHLASGKMSSTNMLLLDKSLNWYVYQCVLIVL